MRALTPRDAKAMAAIHAQSFETGWDALEMSAHLAKDICLGIGDPLRAFIICNHVVDQSEILTVATHADHRRTGLARVLLAETSTHLKSRGVKTLFLEVAEDNLAAQGLYRAAGFTPIGRRPAYYRRAEGRIAALTFSKALDAGVSDA